MKKLSEKHTYAVLFQEKNLTGEYALCKPATASYVRKGKKRLIKLLEALLPKYEGCVYYVFDADSKDSFHVISGVFDPNDIYELKNYM